MRINWILRFGMAAALVASAALGLAGAAGYGDEAESRPLFMVADDWIDRFEGTWFGENNRTPFGPMPFAMHFTRSEDGTLHSHSAMSRGTWVDLRFHREDGGWVLTESAALAGMGEQTYPMHPVESAGDTITWVYREDPHYLTARLANGGERLWMQVILRGEEHVVFDLPRVTGETAEAVVRSLEEAKTRPDSDDLAELQGLHEDGEPVEILNARAAAEAEPENVDHLLALAAALAEAIESAPPARLAAWAQEMYGAYVKAVKRAPERVDARFGLAQYYLNAPPIAGGSADRAEEQGRALVDLESPLGEVVLAQVEAERGEHGAAVARLRAVLERHPDLEIARRLHLQLADERSAR